MRNGAPLLAFAALAVALAHHGNVMAAATPAERCQSEKDKVAGKYAACRLGAEAKLAVTGDLGSYAERIDHCLAKYSSVWQRLEASAGGACPSNGDEVGVGNVINGCTGNIAAAVGGGTLSDCPADLTVCNGDLTTCEAGLAGAPGLRLATGQTYCYGTTGNQIPCAGTGDDGELQKGLARSYVDNGDGTITDERTGLMWEKLSDDESVHDKDNLASWSGCHVMIANLNAESFAGYNDWRLPNRSELESLVHLETTGPAVASAFNDGCTFGCTTATCSCTAYGIYASSTTYHPHPGYIWVVDFTDGTVERAFRYTVLPYSVAFHVRAVRGG